MCSSISLTQYQKIYFQISYHELTHWPEVLFLFQSYEDWNDDWSCWYWYWVSKVKLHWNPPLHIEAKTKWPPFCWVHFQSHNIVWKFYILSLIVSNLFPSRCGSLNVRKWESFQNMCVWTPNSQLFESLPKGPIKNNAALVQIVAWYWTGNEPLSEPMMV